MPRVTRQFPVCKGTRNSMRGITERNRAEQGMNQAEQGKRKFRGKVVLARPNRGQSRMLSILRHRNRRVVCHRGLRFAVWAREKPVATGCASRVRNARSWPRGPRGMVPIAGLWRRHRLPPEHGSEPGRGRDLVVNALGRDFAFELGKGQKHIAYLNRPLFTGDLRAD